MSVNPDMFRKVMSQFATGITVVTTRVENKIHGLTVNAFCSVSLEPPLLLVCIRNNTHGYESIKRGQNFAVNILGQTQEKVAKKFATNSLSSDERFAEIDYRFKASGAPVLVESLGWLDCKLVATYPGGDHTLFLGEVLALGHRNDQQPLLFFQSKYQSYNHIHKADLETSGQS